MVLRQNRLGGKPVSMEKLKPQTIWLLCAAPAGIYYKCLCNRSIQVSTCHTTHTNRFTAIFRTMSKRAKHARCSVIDCTEEHSSLHRPPASEETRAKWIRFIYRGYAPRIHPSKNLLVCSNHFAADSFSNLGQYNAGLAGKMFLKEGAVPTVRGKAQDEGDVKIPQVH